MGRTSGRKRVLGGRFQLSRPWSDPLFLTLAAFIAVYVTAYPFFGALNPANDGVGWDGAMYAALAFDFWGYLNSGQMFDYTMNRILPGFTVWLATQALSIEFTTIGPVVRSFQIQNAILILLSIAIWARLARNLALDPPAALIGLSALLVNFAVLKVWMFSAPLTDPMAQMLGLLIFLLFVEKRRWTMLAVTFIAAFGWPMVFLSVLPLALFARLLEESPRSAAASRWLAAAVAVLVLAIAGFAVIRHAPDYLTPLAALTEPWTLAGILAFALFAAYVAKSVPIPGLRSLWPVRDPAFLVAFLAVWLAQTAVLHWLKTAYPGDTLHPPPLTKLIELAVLKPGLFAISSLVYCGPMLALLLWRLPFTLRQSGRLALGGAVILALFLTMIGDPESRHATFLYPFAVALLCVGLQAQNVSRRQAIAFLIASLILSKLWLPMGTLLESGGAAASREYGVFPWQWFFMNLGPWMSWDGYFLNILLMLAAAVAAGAYLVATRNRAAADLASAAVTNDRSPG